MRYAALVAVLLFTGCSHFRAKPAEAGEAPAAEQAEAPKAPEPKDDAVARLEFVSTGATKKGGNVNDTVYSEKPGDAKILDKKHEDGVLTYTGQLGFGQGSAWAGFGFGVNFTGDASPVDITRAQTITFRLASATTRSLRLRITGPDKAIQNAGCYPVVMQPVTPDLTDYEIPLAKFAPEGWCGPNARTIQQTAPQAQGVEVVDIAYQRAPSTFSVGMIVVK
ncbi:MAG TPA: hypothetical protein VEB43_10630 [Anaeromyxobacter sp.]|nr:hypothetical protein [Anaeromyxobacter sp.]